MKAQTLIQSFLYRLTFLKVDTLKREENVGKRNEKKLVLDARSLVVGALGNFLESERQRKNPYKSKPGHRTRKFSANKFHIAESTVAHIETGRMLGLQLKQLRTYLAAVRGKDDAQFNNSLKKVYEGLKEIDKLLSKL